LLALCIYIAHCGTDLIDNAGGVSESGGVVIIK
ncbi:uncharacterized protein METZ01_LOCUS423157, partial [marine metagenome]